MGSSLQDALVEVVRRYPGSTAREVSAALRRKGHDVHKRDINPLLYRRSSLFRKDGGYVPRWSLASATVSATRDPDRSARTAQVRTRRSAVDRLYQQLAALDEVASALEEPLPKHAAPVAPTPQPIRSGRPRPPLPIPAWKLSLMPWQQQALTKWYSAGGRGVVEAVTGTGKTHLGLEAIAQMAHQGGHSTVLVPTVVLQDQWARKVKEFCPHLRIALVGGGAKDSPERAHVTIAVMHSAASRDLAVGAPNQNLLVADEVHRYGADQMQMALRVGYDLRLGLTATYERDSDDGITDVLDPYFEQVVMSYGYDRAVPEDVVARFQLMFLGVELDPDERFEYDRLSRNMAKARQVLIGAGATQRDLQRDLGRFYAMGGTTRQAVMTYQSSARSRKHMLANSTGKTSAVHDLADVLRRSRGAVVFTQTIESADAAAEELRARGVVSASVHSAMPMVERMANIHGLEDESVRVLCAPKVLDEGLDIPSIDIGVVLASSRTKRQMIQRLGRVIRRKPDGRWANFLVVYARGTVEDPANGAHEGFLDLVRSAAAAETVLPTWDVNQVSARLHPHNPPEPPGNPELAALVRQVQVLRLGQSHSRQQGAPNMPLPAPSPTPRVVEAPPPAGPEEPCQARIGADEPLALRQCQETAGEGAAPPEPSSATHKSVDERSASASSEWVLPHNASPTLRARLQELIDDSPAEGMQGGYRTNFDRQQAQDLAASAGRSIFAVYVEVPPQGPVEATQVADLMGLRLRPNAHVILYVKGHTAESLERQLAGMLGQCQGARLTVELLTGEVVMRAHQAQRDRPSKRSIPDRSTPRQEPPCCGACQTVISDNGLCRCS